MTLDAIRSAFLPAPHAFFGRRGGLSTGVCAGLNAGLGSGDEAGAVAENRRLAADAVLPGAALVSVHQVHSAKAVTVEAPWSDGDRPEADALVTARPGIALGIVTADCAPVLLCDPKAGVVGAAHAGWKGAVSGVIEATVAAMERLGARAGDMAAAIGPTIARRSYEVDEAFWRRLLERDPDHDRYFAPGREGHYQFDLEGFVACRLAGAGVTRVEALGLDTYSDPERFFSYRRACHRGEPTYGRQISIIALSGEGPTGLPVP